MWIKLKAHAKRILISSRSPVIRWFHRWTGNPLVTAAYLEAKQFGWYQSTTSELVGGFQISRDDTVIDVGCGEGGTCRFAGDCGAKVIAVDIDHRMIEIVSKKMQRSRARSYLGLVSDANPLPIPDATATRVVAQEVLEHVDNPAGFIAELVRVGKPGAQYLISVPDPRAEAIQRRLAHPSYWEKPNHLHVFEHDELNRLVEEAGLRIENKTHYSFYWSMWWTLFWANSEGTMSRVSHTPVLKNWNKTWRSLMAAPNGEHVRRVLDEFMPKSQIVTARKAA